jgi:hypothetical protein
MVPFQVMGGIALAFSTELLLTTGTCDIRALFAKD